MIDIGNLRKVLLDGILAGLDDGVAVLQSIPKLPSGEMRIISGLSLELYPWHEYFALSLRDVSPGAKARYYNPAEWGYFEFVSSMRSKAPAVIQAAQVITVLYNNAEKQDGIELVEAAHLIFLCGARALMHESVARKLQSFGIKAPVHSEKFRESRAFEYMVFNSDETIALNYCELVLANRVTKRLLKEPGRSA
jgi:hypothetical protein